MAALSVVQPKSMSGLLIRCLILYIAYSIGLKLHQLVRSRRRYHDIPSLPRHWLWGNLAILGEKMDPSSDKHPDYGIEEIWNELGRPGVFLMDIEPVTSSIIIVADPAIAEAIAQPSDISKYSCLKSDSIGSLWRLMGSESMVTLEGETWRKLRKRFNKGFQPSHLHSLSPFIVSKTRIFVDRLKAAAEDGEVFKLRHLSQDLATDIITTIAIEKDFGSQTVPDGQGAKSTFGFITASRKLPGLSFKIGQGFNLLYYINPVRPFKAWLYDKIQNKILDDLVRDSLKKDRESTDTKSAKAIVQLALSGLQPTPALIRNTRDQIKTFIFAGQDTTATTIQWACYEMSRASHDPRHARYLEKLRAEHDVVFGPASSSDNCFAALDVLAQPETADRILGEKLPYTLAFIKETLRLHPPAGTARRSIYDPKHEAPLTLNINGRPTRVDGLRIYNSTWLIHRNEKVWGPNAHEFNPDRWMDEEYMKTIPVGAWRPFERGPRNCIGQELAMIELKVVLCAVARGLVFEKVGLTGRDGEAEIYSSHEVTAVPVDGMNMKVHLRKMK